MTDRQAEDRDDGVADDLLDRTAMRLEAARIASK
jgi:hypothetical protein